jgi:hypothetical protein
MRLHLIEIHEQAWCPAPIRDGATDCLKLVANVGRQYQNVLPRLHGALEAVQTTRIVDLCSGGGGPWLSLQRRLHTVNGHPVSILLTDLHPNVPAGRAAQQASCGRIDYAPAPVNATRVPGELNGFRTLFTAFHHFPPPMARAILQDAVDKGQGIAIFEQTRRHPLALLIMLVLPLLAFLVVPFIRPFRVSRLLWTYLIPAIPLVLCFDGVVSCLRTYSPTELRALADSLEGPPYIWDIGRVPSPLSPIGVTYAIGYPAADGAAVSNGT